jgi:hypothetical protein
MSITTTTRNATLADLAGLLQNQHTLKKDLVVPGGRIHCTDGLFTAYPADPDAAPYGPFRPTAIFDGHLAEKLDIPVAYVRRMREERIDLYDANVNGWLRGTGNPDGPGPDPRSFLLRTFRQPDPFSPEPGVARAFLSDKYRIIDNLDVLLAALDGVRATGEDVQVLDADLTESRMAVRLAAPGIAVLAPELLRNYRSPVEDRPRAGWTVESARAAAAREGRSYPPGEEPVLFAGLVITNSETGGGRFTITPRFVVQICGNGLQITIDAMKATHLGSRMDEGMVVWSDETQQRNVELVRSQTADAVRTYLNPTYMRAAIAVLEERAGIQVPEAERTIKEVSKQLRFSDSDAAGILNHFIRGGQTTAGGVMQAITSYAQEVADPDTAWDLERQAVEAMDLTARLVRA